MVDLEMKPKTIKHLGKKISDIYCIPMYPYGICTFILVYTNKNRFGYGL